MSRGGPPACPRLLRVTTKSAAAATTVATTAATTAGSVAASCSGAARRPPSDAVVAVGGPLSRRLKYAIPRAKLARAAWLPAAAADFAFLINPPMRPLSAFTCPSLQEMTESVL